MAWGGRRAGNLGLFRTFSFSGPERSAMSAGGKMWPRTHSNRAPRDGWRGLLPPGGWAGTTKLKKWRDWPIERSQTGEERSGVLRKAT